MISVLFLTADPTNASRLRLGEESREIQEKLQLSTWRDEFVLHQRMSVRPADISQALLDIDPQIVHFSGHGTSAGALRFENRIGEIHPVQPEALSALFAQFANTVNCVILNACYSIKQAKAIAKHINYVIGMSQAIGDKAAVAFSVGFYQALGAGRSIRDAYKLGCVQIQLESIPEHLTPVLIIKVKRRAKADKSPDPSSSLLATATDKTVHSLAQERNSSYELLGYIAIDSAIGGLMSRHEVHADKERLEDAIEETLAKCNTSFPWLEVWFEDAKGEKERLIFVDDSWRES